MESDTSIITAGRRAVTVPHRHDLPTDAAGWRELSQCLQCGLTLLRSFKRSATWVVRRVESVSFIDDCTVRRCVSIDYEVPAEAVVLVDANGVEVRILPLAILRRKSLVRFDLRAEDGAALPLLGLRQNQALTLAAVRAWAAGALSDGAGIEHLPASTDEFLGDVVAGDQAELRGAYRRMWTAPTGTHLERLGTDQVFRAVVDRLADSFLLYHFDRSPATQRRIVKFSYDEPFTLRYRQPSYRPTHANAGSEGRQPEPRDADAHAPRQRWSWPAVRAAMGLTPTLIEFPVPAAELAASYHFQVSAPPEIAITKAALLAGRPCAVPMRARRRRPSFDVVGGGYPTVDLHVADVPYGSRSHAHVEVEAHVSGWFAAAVLTSWVSTAILLFAHLAKPEFDTGSALLMSFAAGYGALLVRPDPHRMVTRLLSKVRVLTIMVAVLAFSAAAVVAFTGTGTAHAVLRLLFVASLIPTCVITLSWLSAVRRGLRDDPRESPWEHHRPRFSRSRTAGPGAGDTDEGLTAHEALAQRLELAAHPYDAAFGQMGFHRPAVRVASCEGARNGHLWSEEFDRRFDRRLTRLAATLAAR